MPDNTFRVYEVPMISTQPVASNEAAISILDNSLAYINNALNEMASRLYESNYRNAIIRHDVPISDDVQEGSLVYYNSDPYHARFEPAIAELEALPGDQGESIESPKARVEGIIIHKSLTENTGTMLCGGFYYDATGSVVSYCLGSTAGPGTYYLSPTVAGKATKDTQRRISSRR